MKYFKRLAENVIEKQEKMFKTILVTGARQVGKTTMLKNMKADINYVTLDDMILNQSAIEDPELFLKSNKAPIIIDEIIAENDEFVVEDDTVISELRSKNPDILKSLYMLAFSTYEGFKEECE